MKKNLLLRDAGAQAKQALERPNKRRLARRLVEKGLRARSSLRVALGCTIALASATLMLE